MLAHGGHKDRPVVWVDIICAPCEEDDEGEVEQDGDEEDASFECRGMHVDVRYVYRGGFEGGEEGLELGGGCGEGCGYGFLRWARGGFDGSLFRFGRHCGMLWVGERH